MIMQYCTTDLKKQHNEIAQTILQLAAKRNEEEGEESEEQRNRTYGMITSNVCMMNAIHQLNKRM